MIRIITDSAADFEPWELEQKNIKAVPLSVIFGEKEYKENIDLTKEEFYELLKTEKEMPNLPVASAFWSPEPDFYTGIEAWTLAGGAHHTVLSYDVTAEMMKDFANIMGIEFVHINKNTTVESLEEKLLIADLVWKLR